MKGRIKRSTTIIASVALAALLAVPGAALAKGGPPAGGGGSGGGNPGGGEETATNNLSVPTIFVGSVGLGLPVLAPDEWTDLVVPSGTPTNNWPIDTTAYYYVQGQNIWQAQYELTTSATVTGKWGDNLTGTAKLTVGKPVRVEMGLTYADTALVKQGYTVVKLEPSKEDRNSAYGTKATVNLDNTYSATPTDMVPRVWTSDAYLTISDGPTQYSMPGEINATGAPVFGYNWRPTAAGTYTLTFHVPSTSGVTITNGSLDGFSIDITVTVTAGGGGGGGGRH